MIRRALMGAVMLAMATPAFAQIRYEASIMGGYTFAEGVEGQAVVIPGEGTFNKIQVNSGGAFSVSFGVANADTPSSEAPRVSSEMSVTTTNIRPVSAAPAEPTMT